MKRSSRAKRIELFNSMSYSANEPKQELIRLCNKLEERGLIRKSKSLGNIIGRLEYWQNSIKGV